MSGLSSLFRKGQTFLKMPSEIGAIIPIDLYGDKVLIEDMGDLLVFEALSFHNLNSQGYLMGSTPSD